MARRKPSNRSLQALLMPPTASTPMVARFTSVKIRWSAAGNSNASAQSAEGAHHTRAGEAHVEDLESQARAGAIAKQKTRTLPQPETAFRIMYIMFSATGHPTRLPTDRPRTPQHHRSFYLQPSSHRSLGRRQRPDSQQLILVAPPTTGRHAQPPINHAHLTGRALNSERHPRPKSCRIHRPAIPSP